MIVAFIALLRRWLEIELMLRRAERFQAVGVHALKRSSAERSHAAGPREAGRAAARVVIGTSTGVSDSAQNSLQ